jgi:nucleotide-binding universal stress UspA family protein
VLLGKIIFVREIGMKSVEQPTLMSLKNMLLATDLSASSAMALRYAQALTREHGARVHTLHVSGPDNYQLLCPEAFATTFNGTHSVPHRDSEVLKGLLAGLPCEVPCQGSKVWEVIADVVVRNEIDLLILGTHGRKGLQKLLFGSVAEEVFRNVSCPVLTVGCDVTSPGPGRLGLDLVLLATDLNPNSTAPAYAQSVCEQFGAELDVLHVAGNDEPSGPEMPWGKVRDEITRVVPRVMDLARKPVFLVEYGEPATKILLVAQALGAGLIVLGAHHPRDVRAASHLPWATAARVISGAKCPVLTVRDQDAAG